MVSWISLNRGRSSPFSRYLGKRIGVKKKGTDPMEEGKVVVIEPLTWKNAGQLCADLVVTQHIEGIVAALEVCFSCTYIHVVDLLWFQISCTIIDDNITLAVCALNALIRMGQCSSVLMCVLAFISSVCMYACGAGTGRLDRAIKFGECGACEFVTTLLHWYGYTEADKLAQKVSLEHRASYNKLVLDCITVALGAVEVLAAGCKVIAYVVFNYLTCI
jgi:hypothetical protein